MPSIAMNGMRIEATINGLADIQARMLSLRKDIALKIVRAALKDGAEVIRTRAVRNLQANKSIRTGALARSVIIRSGKANGPNALAKFDEWAGVTVAPTVFEANLDEGKPTLRVVGKRGQAPKGSIKPRAYAHLVEFGVRPHSVGKGDKVNETVRGFKKDRRGRLRKVTIATGKAGPQKGGMHPGVRPKPFMRPAFDTGKFEAHGVLVESVRRRLEEEISKFSKSAGIRRSA